MPSILSTLRSTLNHYFNLSTPPATHNHLLHDTNCHRQNHHDTIRNSSFPFTLLWRSSSSSPPKAPLRAIVWLIHDSPHDAASFMMWFFVGLYIWRVARIQNIKCVLYVDLMGQVVKDFAASIHTLPTYRYAPNRHFIRKHQTTSYLWLPFQKLNFNLYLSRAIDSTPAALAYTNSIWNILQIMGLALLIIFYLHDEGIHPFRLGKCLASKDHSWQLT